MPYFGVAGETLVRMQEPSFNFLVGTEVFFGDGRLFWIAGGIRVRRRRDLGDMCGSIGGGIL